MSVARSETLPLQGDEDVLRARQTVRAWMADSRFTVLANTKMVTATSELARNAVTHGGGGSARLELLDEAGRTGLRLTVEDRGPGIADIEQAMTDGYSTGGSLGLGLGGSRRLTQEFEIWSESGRGTRVSITTWRQA